MNARLRWVRILTFLFLGGSPMVRAQTLDPGFISAAVQAPAPALHIALQADGKRLVAAAATQADGQPVNGLVRYLTTGAIDQGFVLNVSTYQWIPTQVLPLRNGKLLVLTRSFASGSLTRQTLVRLQPDGSVDATFDAGTGAMPVSTSFANLVEQPDGKILVGGGFTSFAATGSSRITRLLADGAVDATFTPPVFGSTVRVTSLALQPDTKLLVGSRSSAAAGGTAANLIRLLANGGVDGSFSVTSIGGSSISSVLLQPDGKILAALSPQIRRFLPNGAADGSFSASLPDIPSIEHTYLLADGSILVGSTTGGGVGGIPFTSLLKLQPNGTRDPTFQLPASVTRTTFAVNTLVQQTDGRLIVGTGQAVYPTTDLRSARTVLLLESNGAVARSWSPELLTAGQVRALALQPDGSILVGGAFSRLGGYPASNLARLHPDGTPDTVFTRRAAVDEAVNALAWHPVGGVMVGGRFNWQGTTACKHLIRVLPSGELDPAFDNQRTAGLTLDDVGSVGVNAAGKVWSLSNNRFVGGVAQNLLRQLPNGQLDPTFQFVQPASEIITRAQLLSNDRLLVLAYTTTSTSVLRRLLTSGTEDPAFTSVTYSNAGIEAITTDAQDRVLLAFRAAGLYELLRYVPNTNAVDASFTSPFALTDRVFNIIPQPNERLLLAGQFAGSGTTMNALQRVMSDGQPDVSFDPTVVQGTAMVTLLQPDGNILLAGDTRGLHARGVAYAGVVRIRASEVLTAAPKYLVATTAVWPVPAHEQLHLSLDATARPQQVQLLDALGRVVRTQAVTQPQLTLDVRQVPAGVYLLRVAYATGSITRRVVVQ